MARDPLSQHARTLESDADLDPLIDRIGDARLVLLGEASHGTAEFYEWRTRLSRRLIAEHGFSFIAVEGDWPDCARVDRFVRANGEVGETPADVLRTFARWPSWMWANAEVEELVGWLADFNRGRPRHRRVGFHGLDVYSLWDSMAAVVEYLETVDHELAAAARRAYNCFEPFAEDAQEYARATAIVPTSCEQEAVQVLRELRRRARDLGDSGEAAFFDAEQNALIARNAEHYYRTMVRGGPLSWNVRDHHMVETLERLMAHYGPTARGVVWEHNTHIGDARFTDMARHRMVNVGQLVREMHGEDDVVLVGFGTYRGTVIAGREWGAPMERMYVPPARPGSFEARCHDAGLDAALFIFDRGASDGGIAGLDRPVDHRAIGVVYDPHRERWGNYVPTILPRRYDAFIHLDETRAVTPLHLPVQVHQEAPETFPSGM